jgi:hypothetical protein
LSTYSTFGWNQTKIRLFTSGSTYIYELIFTKEMTVFFVKVCGEVEETANNLKVTSKANCVLYQVQAGAKETADDLNTPIKNV